MWAQTTVVQVNVWSETSMFQDVCFTMTKQSNSNIVLNLRYLTLLQLLADLNVFYSAYLQ